MSDGAAPTQAVSGPSNTVTMHDIRLAFRSLRATPVVSLVAILLLKPNRRTRQSSHRQQPAAAVPSGGRPVAAGARVQHQRLRAERRFLDLCDLGQPPPALADGQRLRGCTGVVVQPLQSGPERRDASGGRDVRRRRLLRRARRSGADRPHAHRRRRRAGRRQGRTGRRDQLRVLAAPVRRRGERAGSIDHGRRRAVRDRRRHAAGILRIGSRSRIRRGHPARHRAADSREGNGARPPLELVAERDGAAQAGPVDGRGDGRAAGNSAAGARERDAAGLAPEAAGRLPEGSVRRGALRHGRVVPGSRYQRPLLTLLVVVALVLLWPARIANQPPPANHSATS